MDEHLGCEKSERTYMTVRTIITGTATKANESIPAMEVWIMMCRRTGILPSSRKSWRSGRKTFLTSIRKLSPCTRRGWQRSRFQKLRRIPMGSRRRRASFPMLQTRSSHRSKNCRTGRCIQELLDDTKRAGRCSRHRLRTAHRKNLEICQSWHYHKGFQHWLILVFCYNSLERGMPE